MINCSPDFVMRTAGKLLLLFLVSVPASARTPAAMSARSSLDVAFVTGWIDPHFVMRLNELLEANPQLQAVELESGEQRLSLSSDCTHWVVYDHDPAATCVEPQSGPPDAFNIEPCVLEPGETLSRWFQMAWTER
jgi:galactose mutarotase-like enzyme